MDLRGRVSFQSSLSARAAHRLLARLDVDLEGKSRRTHEPAWPESWDLAYDLVKSLDGAYLLVLLLASWLEGFSTTTRQTYAWATRRCLRDLQVARITDLTALPEQAALTWQRGLARHLLPRTVNGRVAALNSLMVHVGRLGLLEGTWASLPAVKITKGRWIDRDGIALSPEELLALWKVIATRPRRQFLALILASLHGLRAGEVAKLTWGAIRHSRRGAKPAPAVLHIVGKGGKHRMVQVHPAIRGYLERHRTGKPRESAVLADGAGNPPSAKAVSAWAKEAFALAGLEGYAHALRATWVTQALENRANSPLQVQQSGGWKDAGTMLGHYYKRRNCPVIRLVSGHLRF